jgi:type IV secretory pathway VirB3-like protein
MSKALGPLLDPRSPQAIAIILSRGAFFRELVIAIAFGLTLPASILGSTYLAAGLNLENPVAFGFFSVTLSAIFAMSIMFYAMLRLNAAVLARERACLHEQGQTIHAALQGPIWLRSSFVAGSVKSRILCTLPGFVGFGFLFGWAASVVNVPFTGLHVFGVLILIIQGLVAIGLLR